jgi:hypothetical protein
MPFVIEQEEYKTLRPLFKEKDDEECRVYGISSRRIHDDHDLESYWPNARKRRR